MNYEGRQCGLVVERQTRNLRNQDGYNGTEKKTQQVLELFRGTETFVSKVQKVADMVLRKKRGKFWNYFEELKPTLVKCTTCKKEIKDNTEKKTQQVVELFRRIETYSGKVHDL
ncbi:hypothetical protein DBV15_03293 [Temnothorax longispinosus]|uniref:BED-type domain-containing protein n=1 Tax=Temnothorax longispinosus TaxID=300112 RepID=A0A4S2JSA0_9HYME|nr:hypothetical protein DBV15_03293 [Temnothorax longispinosus]